MQLKRGARSNGTHSIGIVESGGENVGKGRERIGGGKAGEEPEGIKISEENKTGDSNSGEKQRDGESPPEEESGFR